MAAVVEQDFEQGHPKRFDYDPASPAAREWARVHISVKGERDFPVDHPKAVDTKGNHNTVVVLPGVDPFHPELEAFTGRTPEQAKAAAEMLAELARQAKETPPRPLIDGVKLNEALIRERQRLGVQTLNAAQYAAVLEKFAAQAAGSE